MDKSYTPYRRRWASQNGLKVEVLKTAAVVASATQDRGNSVERTSSERITFESPGIVSNKVKSDMQDGDVEEEGIYRGMSLSGRQVDPFSDHLMKEPPVKN